MRFRYSVQAMIAAMGLGAALLAGVQTQSRAQPEPQAAKASLTASNAHELAQRKPGDLHAKTLGAVAS